MKIKIYTGLSIKEIEVKKVLKNACFAPPICRGDILRDIQSGYQVIGIIDGEFHQRLAVSPGEIMDALRNGLSVFGSSSMGALRAAELDTFGMIGVGKIYNFIKNQDYFSDDFLGQVFFQSSAEDSIPYIDFYFHTESLVQKKVITSMTQKQICKLYASFHFSDRNLSNLKHQLKNRTKLNISFSPAWLFFKNRKSVKSDDARLLLKKIKIHLENVKNFNLIRQR